MLKNGITCYQMPWNAANLLLGGSGCGGTRGAGPPGMGCEQAVREEAELTVQLVLEPLQVKTITG